MMEMKILKFKNSSNHGLDRMSFFHGQLDKLGFWDLSFDIG